MKQAAVSQEDTLGALKLQRDLAGVRQGVAWRLIATLLGILVLSSILYGVTQVWKTFDARPPVPASTLPATAQGPTSSLEASGYVVARRQATVSAKVTGRLSAVLVEEGRSVVANEVIARLDDSSARADLHLASARREAALAALRGAELAVANAAPIYERSREQKRLALISAQDHDAAKARYDDVRSALDIASHEVEVTAAAVGVARQSLDDTIVRAPFSGVITVKAAQQGEIVSPASGAGGFTRTGIGTIVDMDSLEVEVDVSESYIQRVRADQRARVRLGAYPRWTIPAHVVAVIPNADRANGTVRVRVALEERDERILPNMGARVAFVETP